MSWLVPAPVQQRRTMSVAGGSPFLAGGSSAVGVAMEADHNSSMRCWSTRGTPDRPPSAGPAEGPALQCPAGEARDSGSHGEHAPEEQAAGADTSALRRAALTAPL